MKNLDTSMQGMIELASDIRNELGRVVVGQKDTLDLVLAAVLCQGHVLLEGVPGVGKTLVARSAAAAMELEYRRVQFTPDLMPADILGATMLDERDGTYNLRFEPGPVFANIVLADEINRASPKTQSALLEAMQERTVTIRGTRHELPRPFMVLATQNPIEMEGTYPLPEAQIDRFLFKAILEHPDLKELVRIVDASVGAEEPVARQVAPTAGIIALQKACREVVAPPDLVEFASRVVLATQPARTESPQRVRSYCRYGAGPRGAQALVLAAKAAALLSGRFHAGIRDVERFVLPALRHRVSINFEGQIEGITPEDLIADALDVARAGLAPKPALGPETVVAGR
ncbi:MAG: AAA family ATPase [Spirochaetales bacterium]|nr:MAG: AAA family ATPase [Spirochaetales bacterium]